MIDFFPKVEDSLSERTLAGALVSVLSFAFVLWAGAHELHSCMRVETIDRLVPHTSAEHANLLSINLDVHFAALPCSELAIEVRDATGTEALKFRNSVSKLRTTATGVAIGMPERLDFTERVALGMRLHRFMHVLGDALAQLLRFSLRSGCERNYTAACPDHWDDLGHGRCQSPFWYFGHCNHVSVFNGYNAADKEDWSLGCQANWPCLEHAVSALAEADAARSALNATRLRAALDEVERVLQHDLGGGALSGDEEEAADELRGSLASAWASHRVGRLDAAAAQLALLSAAVRDDPHVAALRPQLESALRELGAELEWSRSLADQAANGGARSANGTAPNGTEGEGAAAGGAALGGGSEAPDAIKRRKEKVALATTKLDQGIARLEAVEREHAAATRERLGGYALLQANVSAVLAEVETISPEKEHRQRLTQTLRRMHAQLQQLRDGAAGEGRHQLELALEEAVDGLLRSLKVMKDGQEGEGCGLFGILEVPRVSGQLRIVPATTGAQSGGLLLPDFQVRHALYFNVSHAVRHLSFGTYFPGMHNPLDNIYKHSDEGAAEARYNIKVVPSTYTAINGSVTLSNLYSVTEHFHPLHWHSGQNQLPGVFFAYDISGMKVTFTEQHGASLTGSIARICALVGGVMTVANIIDKIIYRSAALMKNRMGKQS